MRHDLLSLSSRSQSPRQDSSWTRLSPLVRHRYARLIAYHIRRAQRRYPDLGPEDLYQEVEAAIWMACRTWRTGRAPNMQFSTYLHWHLAKRLARLKSSPLVQISPEADLASQL